MYIFVIELSDIWLCVYVTFSITTCLRY